MKTSKLISTIVLQALVTGATASLPLMADESTSQPLTATPIPPVVTGTIDLEEIKPSNIINVLVSQSRVFVVRNKIVRTSISDPSIAEPVLVSENQLVLLGKSPGTVTLVLWDDAGNSEAIDLLVSRHPIAQSNQVQWKFQHQTPKIIDDTPQLNRPANDVKPKSEAMPEVPSNEAPQATSAKPRNRIRMIPSGGGVILMGDVDSPEALLRTYSGGNASTDDRGMNIQASNNRLTNTKSGEVQAGSSR